MTLGQKIKNYRKRAGLSQMELEIAIGASPGAISRIENGVVNPTKETLFSIIENLDLGVEESAEIFNIDISKKVEQLSNISDELNEATTEEELLGVVTNKLVTKLKVKYSTGWLWDQEAKTLRLASISIHDKALAFILNVLKISLDKVIFDSSNKDHQQNFILKSILENKVYITDDMYNFSVPYASPQACKVLSRLIEMKFGVHIPLVFKDKKIGVLGFIWPEEAIPNTKLEEFKFIASLVSAEIYRMRIIHSLENDIRAKDKKL